MRRTYPALVIIAAAIVVSIIAIFSSASVSAWFQSLVQPQVFWLMVSAIGTVGALVFIYGQIKDARSVSAYDFLRKEDERLQSESVSRARSNLARHLLLHPKDYARMRNDAEGVLDYLEDLGIIHRKHLASTSDMWSEMCWYILRYWPLLEGFVDWRRGPHDFQKERDDSIYEGYHRLYGVILEMESRQRKKDKKEVTPTSEELHEFLHEELQVEYLQVEHAQLASVLELENLSFDATDAYKPEHFEQLYREHPDGFIVATLFGEVVGYIIGYVASGAGDVDSVAVNPTFRHLGIGSRLCKTISEDFKRRSCTECSLVVRTTDGPAIQMFKKIGFRVDKTISDYYDDGSGKKADAYSMKMDLK